MPLAVLVAVLAVLAAACGESRGIRAASRPPAAAPAETITVFAAASLTEAFNALGQRFSASRPGTTVRVSTGGSSTLAQQIVQGAPADVFAAASPATMQVVVQAGLARGTPSLFARNSLQIAVPKGDRAGVRTLADLGRPGVKVALCAEQVPCGDAAKRALAAAGVTVKPVTLEQDVKGALTKVSAGEVDAALVYRTDVKAAGSAVHGFDFPEAANAVNDYPVVALRGTHEPAADAFVAFLRGPEGQAALAAAGFGPP